MQTHAYLKMYILQLRDSMGLYKKNQLNKAKNGKAIGGKRLRQL